MHSLRKTPLLVLFAILPALQTACTSKQESAQHYLDEGKALLQQGNIEQARVQIKSAIQNNPNLADAYFQLALVEEKKRDWKQMYGALLETIKLDPNHVDARFKLGIVYLSGQELDKAAGEAAAIEKVRPGNAYAQCLRGEILFFQGQKANGISEVKQALEKEPSSYDISIILASLYLKESKFAETLAVLSPAIAAYPKDTGLRLLKVQTEVEAKNADAAIADYKEIVALNPDKPEFASGLVQLLVNLGRTPEAEAALRDIIAKKPNDADAKLALVDFIRQRSPEEAEKTLTQFASDNPNDVGLQSRLAGYYISKQRYAEAQKLLNHVIEIDPNARAALSAKIELAKIAILQRDEKTAEKLVGEVLAADAANPEALAYRAAMRLDKNDLDGAIADLRTALTGNPRLDHAQILLSTAYQRKGDSELAESTLRQALEINPGNMDAALPIAAKLIAKKELSRAQEVLVTAMKSDPQNMVALQLLAQIRALNNDYAGAQALSEQLAKLDNGSAISKYLSGEISASQKNYPQALKKLQEALAERPNFPEALQAIIPVYLAMGQRAELKSYLKGLVDKNPKLVNAYIALSSAYANDKEWNDALKTLQSAQKAEPKSSPVFQALAQVYAGQGKLNESIEAYRRGLAELPDDVPLLMGLGQAYEMAKDGESAIATYQKALQKAPKLEAVANNLASVLVDYRNDKKSFDEAARLVESFSASENPNLLDTYGWVALRQGDTVKALPVLRRAVTGAPNVAIFRYHLGMAYFQSDDKMLAKAELEKALELATKQGEFVGFDKAKETLKAIGQ